MNLKRKVLSDFDSSSDVLDGMERNLNNGQIDCTGAVKPKKTDKREKKKMGGYALVGD